MREAGSLGVALILLIFAAAAGQAGQLESSSSGAGKDFAVFAAAGAAQALIPGGRPALNDPRPALLEAGPRQPMAVELFCSAGNLELTPGDGAGYNATVNDAGMTRSLRALAAKLPGGERSLVKVTFTGPVSFVVSDLRKVAGTMNYDAGQSAPKLNMLSGGRAVLLLTYSRMTSGQPDDYKELVSLGFSGCVK